MSPRRWLRPSRVSPRVQALTRVACLMTAVLALSGAVLTLSAAPAVADSAPVYFTSDEVGTSGTTPTFTMSAPWRIIWSYSCSDYAQGGSFSLAVRQPSGGAVNPGESTSGVHGGGSLNYTATGTFSVSVTSACYWTLEAYPTSSVPVILGPPSTVSAPARPNPTYVGIAADAGGQGIWTVRADGLVQAFLGGPSIGDPAGLGLNSPIVSMTAARHGGYYLLGGDGGVFAYGGSFYGSTGDMLLNRPVDGMAVTRDGMGYWLVASDGGVFSFGDAPFLGSIASLRLNQPVVGMVAYGNGYTLVAADGGVFNYGTAFLGSLGSLRLNAPVVGVATTPDGGGYWLVARDGGVFNFGDAPFLGSGVGSGKTFTGISSTPDGSGYWLVASDGTILNFGGAASAG